MPQQRVTHPVDPACPYCSAEDVAELKADRERTEAHNQRAAERVAGKDRKPLSPRYTDLPKPKRPAWAVPEDDDAA